MGSIGEETFRFMAELSQNNSRAWFERNRTRYVEYVREPMKALAGMLEDPVGLVLPEFSGKAKVSRINNDLRFAPRKPPYKTRMWISLGTGSPCCANLFAGVDASGWTTGAGIGDSKREPLDTWRTNLLEYRDIWRRYADAIGLGDEAQAHTENPFRKPLYPDLPEYLKDLVQARGVWLVDRVHPGFDRSPFEDFSRGICRFLPAYLFMTLPAENLPARLSELGIRIIAPDREIHDLWKSLID